MSTFRKNLRLTIDGEPFEIRTFVGDNLEAERFLARQKMSVTDATQTANVRAVFNAFGRCYPEHPVAKAWPKFLELLDDMTDADDDTGEDRLDPLDPTLAADWES